MEFRHPIKVVARRTGLSQHVIRVWEKRYGAVSPSRTDTNRRLYSDAEIDRLFLLHQLTKAGHSICRIAHVPCEQLRVLLGKEASKTASGGGVPVIDGATLQKACCPETSAGYVETAMEAIRALDDKALEDLLECAAVEMGQQGLLQQVIVPLTHRMGEEWEAGSIKVSHEHFASCVLRTFLCNSAKPYALPESAPLLLVSTPCGQVHELGAVIVAAAATNKGWRVKYLGTCLPATEISSAAKQSQARAVALSVVYPDDDPHLMQELVCLRKHLPPEVAILVGGRAAQSYVDTLNGIGACLLTDIPQLNRKLDELRSLTASRRLRGVE